MLLLTSAIMFTFADRSEYRLRFDEAVDVDQSTSLIDVHSDDGSNDELPLESAPIRLDDYARLHQRVSLLNPTPTEDVPVPTSTTVPRLEIDGRANERLWIVSQRRVLPTVPDAIDAEIEEDPRLDPMTLVRLDIAKGVYLRGAGEEREWDANRSYYVVAAEAGMDLKHNLEFQIGVEVLRAGVPGASLFQPETSPDHAFARFRLRF